MKILVSCVPFDRGKSGISVYIRHLTAALAAQKQDLTLIVEADAAQFFPDFPKIVLPKFCHNALISMMYHLFILPFTIRFRKFDMMILCAANRRAFCRYPIFTAAVVHDLSQYHVQAKYDAFRMFYIKHLLPYFVRKAQAVTAISHSTANDLREYWHVPEKKISVIFDGLSLPAGDGPDASEWLREHGVKMVEQPLPVSRIDDQAWLNERSPLPLFADESIQGFADVPRMKGLFKGINIKLMKCGGLREAHRMVDLARGLDMQVMLGCMTETSCAVSAAAQLSPAVDFADLDGNLLISNDLFDGVGLSHGKLALPDRPGIGVVKI